MRTVLVIFILMFPKLSFAQFQEIPLSTTANINGIVYSNPYLFINGNENYLAKLNIVTNSITELSPIENTPFHTYSLNIIDTNSLWGIAGRTSPFSDYIIKHSSDGGQTWQNSSDTLSVRLNDLKMNSDTIGYAAGFLGTFYKFKPYNQVWDSLNIGYQYQNVVINTHVDSTIVIASIGFVHTTHNQGLTWQTKSIYDIPSCIYLQNKDTFFLISNLPNSDEASIFTTINSGNNWSISHTTQNFSLNSIAFFNSTQGIAVGANKILSKGVIFITNDAGQTWINSTTQYETEFIKVLTINDGIVFISGTNGKLYKTNKEMVLSTAINNIKNQSPSQLYPNPTDNKIYITNLPENCNIYIYNTIGQIQTTFTNHDNSAIDISNLTKGFYTYSVTDNQKNIVSNGKFIKK